MKKSLSCAVGLAALSCFFLAGCGDGGSDTADRQTVAEQPQSQAPAPRPVSASVAASTPAKQGADSRSSAGAMTTCLTCHQGGRSLAGKDVERIAETIRSIRDGKMAHPPLGLEDASDEAIAALARSLVAQ